MRSKKITGLLLAFTLLLSGCGLPAKRPVNSVINIDSAKAVQTQETTTETTHKPFEFNPHVYSKKTAERITEQDYWDSFYNLCDALRKGEKTFKCSTKEAYEWCTDIAVFCNLFPVAGSKVEGKSDDGSPAFENGIGKIYYKIPVEEFVKTQKDFEDTIVGIINGAGVEDDDTDYEKALKLYVYCADHFVYRYVDYEGECFTYHTFRTKEGTCVNFAAVYAYLLLQVNVDALSVSIYEDNMCHSWTYANIGGKWYHIDVTWAIHEIHDGGYDTNNDETRLDYFMMSDEERNKDGCLVRDLCAQMMPEYWVNKTNLSFAATDNSYNLREYTVFVSLDEKNKVLKYKDIDGNIQEFHYQK